MNQDSYILYYTACLIFVCSSVFCAIVRAAHVCRPYRENRNFYFPAFRNSILSYIALSFTFPYLLHVTSEDSFLYALSFGLLIFPPIIVAEINSYFFYKGTQKSDKFFLVIVPFVLLMPLFIFALIGRNTLVPYERIISKITIIVFIPQLFIVIRTLFKLKNWLTNKLESNFSNLEDFPIQLGKSVFWFIPFLFCLTLLTAILSNSRWMKFICDIVISCVNISFLCYILHPHRTLNSEGTDILDNTSEEKSEEKQSKEQLRRLQKELIELIVNQQMFKNKNLKIDDLTRQLSTNRNYLSEAFAMTSYGSFYKMVNQCRISYSIKLMQKHPEYRMDLIATESGFTSRITFTRVFKNTMGVTPTEWLERSSEAINAKKEIL